MNGYGLIVEDVWQNVMQPFWWTGIPVGGGGGLRGSIWLGGPLGPLVQTSPTFQKLAELVAKMDMKMFGDWNSPHVICSYLLPQD